MSETKFYAINYQNIFFLSVYHLQIRLHLGLWKEQDILAWGSYIIHLVIVDLSDNGWIESGASSWDTSIQWLDRTYSICVPNTSYHTSLLMESILKNVGEKRMQCAIFTKICISCPPTRKCFIAYTKLLI